MAANFLTGRRQLLHMMGLSGAGLFLPSLMSRQQALAAAGTKRLFVYYTPHGPVQQNYTMRPNGPGGWNGIQKADREMSYDFALPDEKEKWSTILKPLFPYRKKTLALEGLAMTSGLADKDTNNHNVGTSHALTGAKMKIPGGFKQEGGGGDTSIDQRVADSIADPERIKSLYYTTGGWSPAFRGQAELKGEADITRAYDKLFPASTTNDATTNWLKKRRQNSLSMLQKEYQEVLPRLSGEDKQKLETHLGLVTDLQKSIAFKTTNVCSYQQQSFATNPGNGGEAVVTSFDIPVARPLVKNFGKLYTAAFACDMTRVGLFVNGGFGPAVSHLDVHTDIHLDIAHNAMPGKPDGFLKMTRYYATLAEEFAQIVGSFDSVQVDGGKTLLDQTTCLWLCELANGPHHLHDILAVVVGGGDFNGFKLGRYVKFKEDQPSPGGTGTTKLGPAHSKLLVSVMKAFGMSDNTIGMTKADTGGMFDLDGALDGIKA